MTPLYGKVTAVGLALSSVAVAAAFAFDCARGLGWTAVVVAPSLVAVPALLGRVVAELRLARRER